MFDGGDIKFIVRVLWGFESLWCSSGVGSTASRDCETTAFLGNLEMDLFAFDEGAMRKLLLGACLMHGDRSQAASVEKAVNGPIL